MSHRGSTAVFTCVIRMAPNNLSAEEKARNLAWKYENVPTKEIARRTGRGESTIRRLISTARGLPSNVVPPRKPASGRPRKTSAVTDALLRREVLKNPKITAGELKKIHPQLLRNVSERTTQHRLQKELGLPTFRPAHKPLFTRAMVKKCLAFSHKYKEWSVTKLLPHYSGVRCCSAMKAPSNASGLG